MNLLPYYRVELRTHDPADLVAGRLGKLVANGWYFFTTPDEPFRGSVAGRHFKVVRVLRSFLGLRYHNSFEPVIVGDVVDKPSGTAVQVRMRLNLFTALFMTVWFGGLLLAAALMLREGLAKGWPKGTTAQLAVVGAMLLVGYEAGEAFRRLFRPASGSGRRGVASPVHLPRPGHVTVGPSPGIFAHRAVSLR